MFLARRAGTYRAMTPVPPIEDFVFRDISAKPRRLPGSVLPPLHRVYVPTHPSTCIKQWVTGGVLLENQVLDNARHEVYTMAAVVGIDNTG